MVRRHEPAGKESRLAITVMMMIGMRLKIGVCCSGVSHILATLSWQLRRVQQQQGVRTLQLRRPWHGRPEKRPRRRNRRGEESQPRQARSEEEKVELQALKRISDARLCQEKKKMDVDNTQDNTKKHRDDKQ